MATQPRPVKPQLHGRHGSLRTYTLGFILSLVLTFAAYLFVQIHVNTYHQVYSHGILVALIITLALTQFIVQLLFFLHLGRETKPRWKLVTFGFMLMIVGIVVFGSLWIMSSLNNRMTPQQMDNYMQSQDGL